MTYLGVVTDMGLVVDLRMTTAVRRVKVLQMEMKRHQRLLAAISTGIDHIASIVKNWKH